MAHSNEEGGTPLFPDLGKHCALKDCGALDFLPFKCDGCSKNFCTEHRQYTEHECPVGNSKDRVVICLCNVCGESVLKVCGQDQAVTLARHAESVDCVPEKNNKTKRCPVLRCKNLLTTSGSVTCKTCSVRVCLSHRFPQDHACKPPSRSSGSSSASRMRNLSRLIKVH